ncbi:MAG TPA: hypothetical protein VKO20_02330 [Desulfosalsimonadaceae bacterium]|nr:hypothetical protein [Desulfosalsimonadaceae bacterium]
MEKSTDFYMGRLHVPQRIRSCAVPFFLVFVLLLACYANSFQGTWIFDDTPNILENDNVHVERLEFASLTDSFYNLNDEITRPLAFFSFGLNWYFGKDQVFGYHLVNFAVHFLTACFLFLLVHKTLRLPVLRDAYSSHAYSIALLATVFWAVNPLQVTAVTYIVQRMAAMAGLFYVAGMYFYVSGRTARERKKQAAGFAAAGLCVLFGLSSKQNAAMLPVSIFFYDLFLIQGVSRQSLKKNLGFAAAALLLLLAAGIFYTDASSILSGYERRPFTLAERLLTQPRVIFFYISQLLYPVDSRLTLIHEVTRSTGFFSPMTTVFSIAGIFGALGFALRYCAKYPLLCFSILFFLGNHAIEGTVVPLEMIYEHRNYVPSFFFFVPVAVLVVRVMDYFSCRRMLQAALALLLVVVWAGQGHTVYMRNKRFADPLSLWADNAEKAPGLSRVHINLGNAYYDRNAYGKAYECYQRAKQADYYHNIANRGALHQNLARYFFHVKKDPEKTLYHAEIARGLYPGNWRGWYFAGLAQLNLGKPHAAFRIVMPACRKWPENLPLHYLRSLALLRDKKWQECIKNTRRALQKDFAPARFYKILGVVYLYQDQLDASARTLEMAGIKFSDVPELMLAMAEVYHRKKDLESRNRVVRRMFCQKGSRSWKQYIDEALKKNALNAYQASSSRLIPLIREAMRCITL